MYTQYREIFNLILYKYVKHKGVNMEKHVSKSEFKAVKAAIRKAIKENGVDCGFYDTRNRVGDDMETIYCSDNITVDVCWNWGYFEVFTDKETYTRLKKYYEYIKQVHEREEEMLDQLETLIEKLDEIWKVEFGNKHSRVNPNRWKQKRIELWGKLLTKDFRRAEESKR